MSATPRTPVLVAYSREDVLKLTSVREFETKIGEVIRVASRSGEFFNEEEIIEVIRESPARFVVFGVPEDIGPRANHGLPGTHEAWASSLGSLLNVQSNSFLTGDQLLVLGHVFVSDLMKVAEGVPTSCHDGFEKLRGLVANLDARVLAVVRAISRATKIPILIGGGHNNCLPLIRGVAETSGWGKCNVVSLDAHSDFRVAEGRHSGNGFRYAFEGGYLQKYAIFGLHEGYNNKGVLERLHQEALNNRLLAVTYEDLVVRKAVGFDSAVDRCTSFCAGSFPVGIEIDLDSVQDLLSSAPTPCGISTGKTRRFLWRVASSGSVIHKNIAYLHITEGIPVPQRPSPVPSIPKFTSYLIADFVKAVTSLP